MKWPPIVSIVMFLMWSAFEIWKDCRKASNTLPYGKRAIKKFVEKVERIYDANRISSGKIVTRHGDLFFPVEIVEKDIEDGLEYKTIPMYKCKAVYIKDEEVARVHSVDSNCKKHYFLEFAYNRKLNEIIEIVDAAYNVAEPIYKAHHDNVFTDRHKSFYEEEK